MATAPDWIAALIAAGLFAAFAGYNARIALLFHVARDWAPSYAPVFGGVAGLGAVLAVPLGSLGDRLPYGLIPLVLDIGCLPYLTAFFWMLLRNRRSRRQ